MKLAVLFLLAVVVARQNGGEHFVVLLVVVYVVVVVGIVVVVVVVSVDLLNASDCGGGGCDEPNDTLLHNRGTCPSENLLSKSMVCGRSFHDTLELSCLLASSMWQSESYS